MELSASVRNKDYQPAPDAKVTAHFIGPDGLSALMDMTPAADNPGVFHAVWTAGKPGSYLAEVTANGKSSDALGSDAFPFQRIDGVAENFHTVQNRELLEKLASETGGRYWEPGELSRLPNEISYSDAGISARDVKELWNMPVVFLFLLLSWRRNGCCAASGVWYESRSSLYALCYAVRARQRLLRYRRWTWGEPDYDQRFTADAKDLDKLFKASGNSAHVYTLTGSQATRAQLTETLDTIAHDARPEDDFVLILIGHGSFDGATTSSTWLARRNRD